jgi:tetratricopeptide (TPR) repeat protein
MSPLPLQSDPTLKSGSWVTCCSTLTRCSSLTRRVTRGGLQACWLASVAVALTLIAMQSFALADDDDDSAVVRDLPLIDHPQAFDLIILKKSAGGGMYMVAPIPFPNRQLPATRPEDDRKLEDLVLLRQPARKYEIHWRDIETIRLYEQMIYEAASERLQADDFVGAFMNLSFLMKNYPEMPNLEGLRREFLKKSAAKMYQAREFRQTLSALEELKQTAPDYSPEQITRTMSNVADALINSYIKGGQLENAKKLHSRLKTTYGSLPVVEAWDNQFEKMAAAKKAEAEAFMAEGKFVEARIAANSMLEILPKEAEAQELVQRILRIHPMVRVAVMQQATEFDPASLDNWPARRAGALVTQAIFQFNKTGSEGGKYDFALGAFRASEDHQEVLLTIEPKKLAIMDGFALTQLLLQRADPNHPEYDPSWGAICSGVTANSATQVSIRLRRSNVLPHALLQWKLPDSGLFGQLPGAYTMTRTDTKQNVFAIRETSASTEKSNQGQPVEIIEVFYDDPKLAINDFMRGDLDIIDQIYPADAKRLASFRRVQIGAYALPSVHMLVPKSDNPFLARNKFKRALLHASNRESMLKGELLNSTDERDGRVISGPFPIGIGGSDPLSYAYNKFILPAPYDPQLAKLLIMMTKKEVSEAAQKAGQKPPELEKLLIACPDFEFARVAVQALIQQWAIVGVEAEMIVLPTGKSYDRTTPCDLLYLTTTPWEPATDVERLLGGKGIAATDNPYIAQSLERLRVAKNWREVRDNLQNMHQLIDFHLPIIPLWQVTDRFAVNNYLEGIENAPVSLYENVSKWRINLSKLEPASNP